MQVVAACLGFIPTITVLIFTFYFFILSDTTNV